MQLAGWGMSTMSAVSIPSCAALASHADSSVLSAATVCVRRQPWCVQVVTGRCCTHFGRLVVREKKYTNSSAIPSASVQA